MGGSSDFLDWLGLSDGALTEVYRGRNKSDWDDGSDLYTCFQPTPLILVIFTTFIGYSSKQHATITSGKFSLKSHTHTIKQSIHPQKTIHVTIFPCPLTSLSNFPHPHRLEMGIQTYIQISFFPPFPRLPNP